MGKLKLNRDYFLLLLFKDSLQDSPGQGFPLISESPTIQLHLGITDSSIVQSISGESLNHISDPLLQYPLFPQEILANDPFWPNEPPSNHCVWGWWRKPWEYHPELFLQIKKYCSQNKILNVLLYNQYLRRIYKAKLYDIFFLPYLTSVEIPIRWFHFCPSYYRKQPRLCGAFLVLQIDPSPMDDTSSFLKSIYVDSSSFELRPMGLNMVFHPEIPMFKITSDMVDNPIDRNQIRLSEHTVLLLRKYKHIEYTKRMLERRRNFVGDEALTSAFKETKWADIQHLLFELPPSGWRFLERSSNAISEIANKAEQAGSRLTRFDLELISWLFAKSTLLDMLITSDNQFTPLGKVLKNWVLAASPSEARNCAAEVFDKAWDSASNRYGLSSLSDYFQKLPPLEAVSSAVHHEIDKKFYRDHLSHNIRAALLGAKIANDAGCEVAPSIDAQKSCFFAGLLHDIAFPISSFPDTVKKLASVVGGIQGIPFNFRPASLIDDVFLQLSLHYVALLSSVPSLLDKYPDGFNPWDNPDAVTVESKTRLLDELLLSARAENHAIISSAILFHRAVAARSGTNAGDIDSGVRTLMLNMTGPSSTSESKELLSLIQSIALHDRKASLKFHPVSSPPKDTPSPLNWHEFQLPIIVSVADELQEWGRPIGSIEEMGIIDSQVKLQDGTIQADYRLNKNPAVFSKVPYSLLFLFFSKLRMCRMYRIQDNSMLRQFKLACSLRDTNAFKLCYIAYRDFSISFGDNAISVVFTSEIEERMPLQSISGSDNQHLLGIQIGENTNTFFDFIIIEGSTNACSSLIEAANSKETIISMELQRSSFRLECKNGMKFSGEIQECVHGNVERRSCVPTAQFPSKAGCTLIRISIDEPVYDMMSSEMSITVAPHLIPHPHILDFDWRFSERTAKWIISAAKHYSNSGEICYLGCPTLAIWHSLEYPEDSNWWLMDRGHFAFNKWVDHYFSRDKWFEHDVFDSLPQNQIGRFSVVVADPPWYKSEYEAFCRTTGQLIDSMGIIFLSSYPPLPPYKREKFVRFNQIIKDELCNPIWLGSMEIDYEIPPFESSWGGHKRFIHSGHRVYRPGYLDVYRICRKRAQVSSLTRPIQHFPETIEMSDDHHMKYKQEINWPIRVIIETRTNVHFSPEYPEIIGWTSKNKIIRLDERGQLINSLDALVAYIEHTDPNQA